MVRLVDAGSVMVVGDLLEVWVDSIEVKEASVTGLDSLLPLHKRMSGHRHPRGYHQHVLSRGRTSSTRLQPARTGMRRVIQVHRRGQGVQRKLNGVSWRRT